MPRYRSGDITWASWNLKHRQLNCLPNSLFVLTTIFQSLHNLPSEGNLPMDFPKMSTKAGCYSISWRHHGKRYHGLTRHYPWIWPMSQVEYTQTGLETKLHMAKWWRHQMETFSALSVTGEFPAQRPVTRSFDVFFDLRLNKRLGKQS